MKRTYYQNRYKMFLVLITYFLQVPIISISSKQLLTEKPIMAVNPT